MWPAERHTDFHRHAQRPAGQRHCPRAAAQRQGKAAEDFLYHTGVHKAAYLRVFVNNAELFHFSYSAIWKNQIREQFGLEGRRSASLSACG
jgi:predicted GTPase